MVKKSTYAPNAKTILFAWLWAMFVFCLSVLVLKILEFKPCEAVVLGWNVGMQYYINNYCHYWFLVYCPALILAMLTFAFKFPKENKINKLLWVLFWGVLCVWVIFIAINLPTVNSVIQNNL